MSFLEIGIESGEIKQEDPEYEDDFQFQPILKDKFDPTLNNKCGEIFLEENDTVIILCTYCKTSFIRFAEFMLHLKENHPNTEFEKNEPHSSELEEKICKTGAITELFPFIDVDVISHDIPAIDNDHDRKNSQNGQDNSLTLMKVNPSKKKISNTAKNTKCLGRNSKSPQCNEDSSTLKTSCKLEKDEDKTTDRNDLSLVFTDSSNDCEENNRKFCGSESTKIHKNLKKCRFCSSQFTNERNRTFHERIHTGEGPFKCEICSKEYNSRSYLKVHKRTHENIRPFKCAICNAAFKDNSNLKAHEKRHTGEKNYQCSYCDKSFYQRTEKKQHERIHTGERPYQCNECGKCFSRSGELTVHNRKHSGEKPHKCEYCGKCFFRKCLLKDHLKVHSSERPISCEICNATFSRKKALQSHIKIHSDVAEYVCKVCGKGFKQSPGLYSHMKSHGIIFTKS